MISSPLPSQTGLEVTWPLRRWPLSTGQGLGDEDEEAARGSARPCRRGTIAVQPVPRHLDFPLLQLVLAAPICLTIRSHTEATLTHGHHLCLRANADQGIGSATSDVVAFARVHSFLLDQSAISHLSHPAYSFTGLHCGLEPGRRARRLGRQGPQPQDLAALMCGRLPRDSTSAVRMPRALKLSHRSACRSAQSHMCRQLVRDDQRAFVRSDAMDPQV